MIDPNPSQESDPNASRVAKKMKDLARFSDDFWTKRFFEEASSFNGLHAAAQQLMTAATIVLTAVTAIVGLRAPEDLHAINLCTMFGFLVSLFVSLGFCIAVFLPKTGSIAHRPDFAIQARGVIYRAQLRKRNYLFGSLIALFLAMIFAWFLIQQVI